MSELILELTNKDQYIDSSCHKNNGVYNAVYCNNKLMYNYGKFYKKIILFDSGAGESPYISEKHRQFVILGELYSYEFESLLNRTVCVIHQENKILSISSIHKFLNYLLSRLSDYNYIDSLCNNPNISSRISFSINSRKRLFLTIRHIGDSIFSSLQILFKIPNFLFPIPGNRIANDYIFPYLEHSIILIMQHIINCDIWKKTMMEILCQELDRGNVLYAPGNRFIEDFTPGLIILLEQLHEDLTTILQEGPCRESYQTNIGKYKSI